MTRSTTTSKKTILRLLLFFTILGAGLLWFDEGQGVCPASSQCPNYSCNWGWSSGCTKSAKEHQGTTTVATVGYEEQHGQFLQVPIPASPKPSVATSFAILILWVAVYIFSWCFKLDCVAHGIAACGVATLAMYLLTEMPAKDILGYVTLSYTTPVVLGLLYEHRFNT